MNPISLDELKRRMLQCGGISPDDAENEAVMELFAANERAEKALRNIAEGRVPRYGGWKIEGGWRAVAAGLQDFARAYFAAVQDAKPITPSDDYPWVEIVDPPKLWTPGEKP